MRAFLPARALAGLAFLAVTGCKPSYSPDTYSSNAVQQANKVEQGLIVGRRFVDVRADGTVGAAGGAAAGGVIGAQAPSGIYSALGAVGGGLVGGLLGAGVERAQGDTVAMEYVVRKGNGDMVSVTQKDKQALPLGQKVLVISGNQARIVPDYTVDPTPAPAAEPPTPAVPAPPPVRSETLPAAPAPAAPQTAPAPAASPISPGTTPLPI